MADQLTKLKKIRGVIKSSITSIVKRIEDAWVLQSPNFDEWEENLAQLEQKGIDLKREDEQILALINNEDEIEKDAKASIEYHGKITLWKFRINKKLKNNSKIQISPVSHVENKHAEVVAQSVKLP